MRLLGISGSLRRGSYNTRLLRAAARLLPPGAALELWDRLREVPVYSEDDDHEPAPEPVRALRAAIASAHALFIATPEYNRSVPGQLKNALDWASRPFPLNALRNKPVAVVGASIGAFGAVWAQAELRKVLGASGARVLDREFLLGPAAEAFGSDGKLTDPEAERQLADILDELRLESAPVRRVA